MQQQIKNKKTQKKQKKAKNKNKKQNTMMSRLLYPLFVHGN